MHYVSKGFKYKITCLSMPELQPKNSKHTSTNDCSFVKNNFALLKADTYLAGQPECCACVCLLFSHTKFALTVVL